jgi:capsular polysaccharide biosynthesis protein
MKKGERSIKFIKIDSIVHYIQHHRDCRYILIEKAKERVVEKPAFFERCESEIVKFDSPEVYVAEILHVKLVGASNIIIVGNKLLNDTVYYDDDNRIDIRFSSVKKVISKIAVIETTTFNKYIPVAINLVAAASFNYYHLLVEILSKLAFVDTIVEFREYPILVDKIVIQIPQYKEALTCINKYNHPIITLDKEEGCQVERLICPSSNVWMPINVYHRNLITTKDFLISETVLLSIRNSVKLYQDKRPWRKIFISRKNTSAVRLENELEIRNLFVDDGFEIVYTEEMSFQQQIDTFGQAKIVVATSGAALTNIIFCQEKTTIGCIIPESHKFYMYSTIAYLLGMNTLFIDADVIKVTHYTAADTFLVDVDYAKRYLASLKQIVNTSN